MSSPIGGFMPIPLAMMMPFMAAQSMLMGDAFGKGFQFGKRKISAMSNEEFNSLTMSNMVSNMQTEFKALVPTLQQSIIESRQVQNVIIEEMIKIVPEFLKFLTIEGISQITKSADEIAHTIGTHVGHDTTITSPSPTSPPPTTNTLTVVTQSTIHNITTRIWSNDSITTSGTALTPSASLTYTWAGGSDTTKHYSRDQHHGIVMAIWSYGKMKNNNNLMLRAIAYSHAWNAKYQAFFVGLN